MSSTDATLALKVPYLNALGRYLNDDSFSSLIFDPIIRQLSIVYKDRDSRKTHLK